MDQKEEFQANSGQQIVEKSDQIATKNMDMNEEDIGDMDERTNLNQNDGAY